ncbi:DUF6056 family protein [Companilactobacillus jidongensis]|uniref:DUF6056 family protein n=1 Tax=Companilactobacillus jidongensis TaxID=2486006 RepID=UPI000F784C70|nr:DUF6056 family protein [Companilactobacillus jidongensis]
MRKILGHKWQILSFAGLYVYLFVFRFFVLPSADDYFWMGWQGKYLMEHGFFSTNPIYDGSSNGRFLGNTFEVLTLHHLLLAMVTFAFFWTLLVWAFWKLAGKSKISLILSMLFIFAMSSGHLNNMLVWNAGFVNYVPAAALLLTYLAIYKDGLDDDYSRPKWISLITFIVAVTGGLFVEHINLYQVFIGVLAIIAAKYLFHKRIQLPYITYLLGSIISIIIMFSHQSYRMHSSYRKSGIDIASAVHRYITITHFWIITFNIFLILMICLAIAVVSWNKFKSRPARYLSVGLSVVFAVYYWYLYWYTRNVKIMFAYVYVNRTWILTRGDAIVSVLFLIFMCIFTFAIFKNDKNKYFVYFYLFSFVALTVPFLFVISPINIREYFHSYVFFYLLGINFANKAVEYLNLNWEKYLIVISSLFISLSAGTYMYKMVINYRANIVRVSEPDFLNSKRTLNKHVTYRKFVYAHDEFPEQSAVYWKDYLNKSFIQKFGDNTSLENK